MHSRTIVSHRILLFLSLFTLACYGSRSVSSGSKSFDSGTYETVQDDEWDSFMGGCWAGYSDTVCIVYSGDTEAWCASLGSYFNYDPAGCPGGETNSCDIPAGGDFPLPATAYYYDIGDPQGACDGVGGTLNQ